MAKKRHHSSYKKQNRKDRMHESRAMDERVEHERRMREHESRGMYNYESAHHSSARGYMKEEMYAGKEMRDRMEYDASMMVHEDKSATANLPQNVIMKKYPGTPYAHGQLSDTIKGIDYQLREDSKHQKSGEYPEMY